MIALALIAYWIRFARDTIAGSIGGMVAPGAFLVPVLFSGVAIAAGVSALKDNGVAVALSGMLSLVPVGLYLLLFPRMRPIGLLDIALVAVGIAMLRSATEVGEDEASSPLPARSGPGSDHRPSP